MSSSYTSLLGFVQPTTGELTNTWGSVVNAQLTQLVEDAIASASTKDVTAGDWTLTTTAGGAANEARSAALIVTGTPGTTRNIYAPKQNKLYVVINNSNSNVVIKGGPTSPTTGVTVVAAGISLVAWNSNISDFVAAAAGVTSLTAGSGVSVSASTGAVTVANTGVTSAVAGTGIGVSGATGAVTFTNSGVTSVTAGAGISLTGSTGGVTITSIAAAGPSNMAVFTSSGTWTVPAGIVKCKVTVIGGGGGGGAYGYPCSGGGGGGAGGGGAIKIVSGLTPGGTVSVTVGAGGTAVFVGSTGTGTGGTGGTSSFGGYCSATGGAGGTYYAGGAPGVGSGGDLNIGGSSGTSADGYNGVGGASFMGGGGNTSVGKSYGGGGAGVNGINVTSYAGAAGVVFVEY